MTGLPRLPEEDKREEDRRQETEMQKIAKEKAPSKRGTRWFAAKGVAAPASSADAVLTTSWMT
jgi:hypothetical protein